MRFQGKPTGTFRLRDTSNLKFVYFLACLALCFAACEGTWGDAIESRQPSTRIDPAVFATAMRRHACFVPSFSIHQGVSGCVGQWGQAVKSVMQCAPRDTCKAPERGLRLCQLRTRDSRLPLQSRPHSGSHSGGHAGGAKHPQQPSRARSTSIQLNKALLECTRIADVCALIRDNIGDFNNVNVATAFTKLAKLHRQTKAKLTPTEAQALVQLTARASLRMNDFKPQEVANTLWALATMGLAAEEGKLIQALTTRASKIVGEFNALEVDNTLWALRKMGLETEETLEQELAERAKELKEAKQKAA